MTETDSTPAERFRAVKARSRLTDIIVWAVLNKATGQVAPFSEPHPDGEAVRLALVKRDPSQFHWSSGYEVVDA